MLQVDDIVGAIAQDLRGNIIGEVHEVNDDDAVVIRPVRCRGCLVRDADTAGLPEYRLCESCMNDTLTFIVLRDLVTRFIPQMCDHAIERAFDHLREIDARNAEARVPYIDAQSSAWDTIVHGHTYTDVRDQLFTLLTDAMHDCPHIPHP